MNRDELVLEEEHLDLTEALDEAKRNYNGEEEGPTQKALKDAEWALAEFRQKWRGIRDYFSTVDPQPLPEGHALASPEAFHTSVRGQGIPEGTVN